MNFPLRKLEIFVPEEAFSVVCDALWSVDAGHIGRYDRCLSWSEVSSCWRPLDGSHPYLGQTGKLCRAKELKLEVTIRAEQQEAAIAAIKAVHPYEEPVINILPLMGTSL